MGPKPGHDLKNLAYGVRKLRSLKYVLEESHNLTTANKSVQNTHFLIVIELIMQNNQSKKIDPAHQR